MKTNIYFTESAKTARISFNYLQRCVSLLFSVSHMEKLVEKGS